MGTFTQLCLRMLNRPPLRPVIPTLPEQAALPRLIHQTFPSGPLPPEIRDNMEALKAMNPTWRHTLYDDAAIEDFIGKSYGERVLRSYRMIDPLYGAARADLFRYLLLYKVGGLYLDSKSSASRPLDSVLRPDDRYLIAQWPNGIPGDRLEFAGIHHDLRHVPRGEFQQWFVCAAPGHPFLKAVLENVLRNLDVYSPPLHGIGKFAVLRVTGPIAYTLAIAPLLDKHPHRRVESDRELGFQYTIYQGDMERHVSLFKSHYSNSTRSLVQMAGARALATDALLAMKNFALRVKASRVSG
jgi:hypothetical protein